MITQSLLKLMPEGAPIASTPILPFETQASLERLARAEFKAAFFALTRHYRPQENRFYCASTSAIIVMNALRAHGHSPVQAPLDLTKYDASDPNRVPPYIPIIQGSPLSPVFQRYSEATFFNARTDRVKTKDEVYGFNPTREAGIHLTELFAMLLQHQFDTAVRYVEEAATADRVAQMANEMKHALGTPGEYVIVNYHRGKVHQNGRGHFSPVGAYDETSGSFLVLDVNPHVHGWCWINEFSLYQAMQPTDTDPPRGYLFIREGISFRNKPT